MIEIGKNGMVKKAAAVETGLPIYDYSESDYNTGMKFDYCTRSELALLEIYLNEDEQQNYIIGFFRDKGYRGLLPLYSLEMIRFLKDI